MRYFVITLLALLLIGASLDDARKANEAYEKGNYEKAITLYKKAIDANPKNTKLYFNLANAQTKAGKNKEAIRTFEEFKAMTKKPEERAKADYNLGNVLAGMKKWDKAVDYYKKSLRYMASDADAKHNFELAKQKEQKQKKKNQQNKDKKNNKNKKKQNKDQDKQQKKKNQDKQNKNQQKKNDQNPKNKQKQNQQKDQQKIQNKKQQRRQASISKDQAEKILKALEQKEKDLLKQFKKPQTESSKSKNEKDW